MIKALDYNTTFDGDGLISLTVLLHTDQELTEFNISNSPVFRLKAYEADGTEHDSSNPLIVEFNGITVNAAANSTFQLTVENSVLNWAQGLPLYTDLNIQFVCYADFDKWLHDFDVSIDGVNIQQYNVDLSIVKNVWFADTRAGVYSPTSSATMTDLKDPFKPIEFLTMDYQNNIAHYSYNSRGAGNSAANILNAVVGLLPADSPILTHFSDGSFLSFCLQSVDTSILYDPVTRIVEEYNTDSTNYPYLGEELIFGVGDIYTSSIEFILGSQANNTKATNEMYLTKNEFIDIAEQELQITSNKLFYKPELITFSHDDAENAKTIELTPDEGQDLCFIRKINVFIAAQGTTYSLKVFHKKYTVDTLLKVIPEGIEGTAEAGGYFADRLEVKGNVTGQILVYKAFKI